MIILLIMFITVYPKVKTIVRSAIQSNGRVGYMTLVTQFEGVGALAVDLIEIEQVIKDIFYLGGKKPDMYWNTFEKYLTYAYVIIDH